MIKKTLLAALVVALLALGWTFTPQKLPLPEQAGALLPPVPATTIDISVAETGTMDSNALLAYRGGEIKQLPFGMDCFVIRHPRGIIVFEGGFGRNLAEHMKTVPWLMRTLAKVHAQTPLADQLQAAGIAPGQLLGLFITHSHWDHIGAVEDLKGVPVFVNRTEREFIANGGEATALMRSFEPLNYQVYDFDGPAYAGFPASHDVFGDGSVVIVPIAGHTPGSVVAFVRTVQHDYALIGDQAWQHEGVDIPAERPWLSRRMVDEDPATVRANLGKLHQLQAANPRLVIVPSHDRRVTSTLPRFLAVSTTSAEVSTQP
ncbi:MBL fold metallo-hydrolase [Pseudomonas sp. NBRC 100443]|uniref:MBL fold metallo-hydrolase n=1 Tax=Pseudomonas sp. NBRC 100443 TaxID=1113665 RepID=UPI0024A37B57|nr:MBL fold metallo-hydrolase [Pseudomonas sp. NBRC 100443]GLU37610.1 MBL fold metallo-hydrolase [Pseudomonas sp. NBRC 100443]